MTARVGERDPLSPIRAVPAADYCGDTSRLIAIILSTITCDGVFRPVPVEGASAMRNRGASIRCDVTGQTTRLAWVALNASDCTPVRACLCRNRQAKPPPRYRLVLFPSARVRVLPSRIVIVVGNSARQYRLSSGLFQKPLPIDFVEIFFQGLRDDPVFSAL